MLLAASAATALLVGGPADAPPRLLTPALRPAAHSPVLPRATSATVLSPAGDRFAAVSRRRIALYTRTRTAVRRTGTVPARGAVLALWPARRTLALFGFDGRGREVLRFVALPSGRVRRTVRLGERLAAGAGGGRVRVVQRTSGGLRADTFSASGRRRARVVLPLPAGTDPGLARADLSGDLVLLSSTTGAVAPYTHRLVRLGGPSRSVALAGAVYGFAGRDLVTDGNGHLARIDRRGLGVRREVPIPAAERVTPFAGGAALGLGRLLLDRRLDRIARHPAVPRPASAPVAVGRRLYALTLRCPASGPVQGAVGVDARAGEVAVRRARPFTLGALGGPLSRPAEDGCD